MALAHSPKIITDGLVLCLDAGNTKSYPGSGTTWTDLSGQGNNGTITGAVYSNGYFDFDAANDDDNGTNSGSAHIYETPQVYTLYDAIDLQSVGITTL